MIYKYKTDQNQWIAVLFTAQFTTQQFLSDGELQTENFYVLL
jgi:hypothetical protein